MQGVKGAKALLLALVSHVSLHVGGKGGIRRRVGSSKT